MTTKQEIKLSVAVETAAQHRAWEQAAKKDGRSLSSWVRFTLDQAARKAGVSK